MSRFEEELNGKWGEYFKNRALEEIEKFQICANNGEILLDDDGGAYWKESGNYLPSNCVEILLHTDFKFSPEATAAARDRQQDEFLAQYRRTAHIVSAEELCEMRAAFGPGETVVNLITGESIRL